MLKDDQLGDPISTIALRPGGPDGVAFTLVISIMVLGFIALSNIKIAPVLSPLGLLAVGIATAVYVNSRKRPANVDVYQNGIVVRAPAWQKTLLWPEVSGVQISQLSDVYYSPRYSIPFAVPLGIVNIFGIVRGGGDAQPLNECRYVFHMMDQSPVEVNGDSRLFGLASVIKDKVFAEVIPEMVKRFEAGAHVQLTDTVSYSKSGLSGTLVRETRHSRREIQIDLKWADIQRLARSDTIFRITDKTGQMIVLQMGEIINAPGFLKILANLHEQDVLPPVSR